jgi:exopolysaccharide biosynthesis polyprenyl glycosylphosphotransferase
MIRYFEATISPTEYRLLGQLCSQGEEAAGVNVPFLGDVADLGDLLIHHPIHEVIAIQPLSNGGWIERVIQACDYMGVLLRIVPEVLLREQHTLKKLYPFVALNLPAIVLTPPHWDSDELFVKRAFDLMVSVVLLILLSPLFLAVAVAIKLTTPQLPVFYPWRVVGQNGVEFTGYKFTTMEADADERKAELEAHNEMTGPVFKMKNDPRVMPLGRFLRKYSINELPQLWSVLKGDMSLVGPRPAGPHELVRYEFWHKRKLSIRPGITCLWQIRGRNKISNFDDWVRMDLEYIDKWSLWLDLRILVRTAWVVISGTGS